jgi:hypothetical protein
MLTPMDDYLAHQIPETFANVGSSDRGFYDRHYFNCHTLDGSVFLVLAFGSYANLGVMDAFATVVHEGKEHIVRASRELNFDREDTRVGPLSVEVLEGLRRLRIVCGPNDWGLEYDLTFEASVPPYQEPRFFRRALTRVVMDYVRFTQVGRWSGRLKVAGKTFEVTPDRWWGARDRSWGVRTGSVGDPEPPSAVSARGPRSFFWQWAPIQFQDSAILYTITEESDGSRWHESAVRLYPEATKREPDHLTIVSHALKMRSGTRIFDGGRIVLAEPGGRELKMDMRCQSIMHMAGAGYLNFSSDWRHGHYHGVPLAVDGEVWDLSDSNLRLRVGDHTEGLCEFKMGDAVGRGIMEYYCLGPYEPYGFMTATDVAP